MPVKKATATATAAAAAETAARAVRYVPGTARSPLGTIYLRCRVTPGASHAGVSALTDDAVELRVAAPPREGEANEAVVRLLGKVLHLRKSDLKVTQGLKSRDKVVAVTAVPPLVDSNNNNKNKNNSSGSGSSGGAEEQAVLQKVQELLGEAVAEWA